MSLTIDQQIMNLLESLQKDLRETEIALQKLKKELPGLRELESKKWRLKKRINALAQYATETGLKYNPVVDEDNIEI